MPLPSVTVNDRFSNQPGMLWSGVLAEIEAVRARANPNKARSFRDEQPCRKLVTKRLTRQFGERISPLLDAGTIKPASAGVCASGRFLTSWIERRDAWAAVRASDACWTLAQTHLTTLSLLPSSGNRYAFVFGILTLSVRRGPRGPRRMGEVNLRV